MSGPTLPTSREELSRMAFERKKLTGCQLAAAYQQLAHELGFRNLAALQHALGFKSGVTKTPRPEIVQRYDRVSSEIRGLQLLLRAAAPGVFAEVVVDDVGLQWDGERVIYASLPLLEAPGDTRLELRPYLPELQRVALAEAKRYQPIGTSLSKCPQCGAAVVRRKYHGAPHCADCRNPKGAAPV